MDDAGDRRTDPSGAAPTTAERSERARRDRVEVSGEGSKRTLRERRRARASVGAVLVGWAPIVRPHLARARCFYDGSTSSTDAIADDGARDIRHASEWLGRDEDGFEEKSHLADRARRRSRRRVGEWNCNLESDAHDRDPSRANATDARLHIDRSRFDSDSVARAASTRGVERVPFDHCLGDGICSDHACDCDCAPTTNGDTSAASGKHRDSSGNNNNTTAAADESPSNEGEVGIN
jgi:hypothetical protein